MADTLIRPIAVNVNTGVLAYSGSLEVTSRGAYKAGWYVAAIGSTTPNIPAEAVAHYSPIIIPKACSIDRLVAEVTTGGTSGALVRIGLYDSDANGLPGTLLVDSGTADGTSNTVKENTVSLAIATPGLYWGSIVAQGGAGTRSTLRSLAGSPAVHVAASSNNAVTFGYVGYTESGVSGALPPAATPSAAAGTISRIAVRYV